MKQNHNTRIQLIKRGEHAFSYSQTAVHEFSVKKLREHATLVFQEEVGVLVTQIDQAAEQGTTVDLQVSLPGDETAIQTGR